ncbi:MAG TPA: FAD-binding oxidoreductase [Streptosporangiaceae bacterium]|jgi:hypothetical protein
MNVDALIDRVQGPVTLPGADAYDAERAGFQTGRQHRPDVIVGATGAPDVLAAVEFAGARRLPVAVQATGHGLGAAAAGGVLITTRRMDGIQIDADGRTAWVEAGVTAQRLVDAAAAHGLAPLTGSSRTVGVVSYTLGGGLGLLGRQYGYAADHVQAIDIVTADGRLRHVTADADPDLFWALRGAGASFGVVAGLRIGLEPVARVYGGGMFFAAEHAEIALHTWREWTATVPDELTSSIGLIPMPDLPVVPEPIRGRHVVHVRFAYTGDAASGERLVAPLRAIGPRLIDDVRDLPYAESGTIYNDPPQPHAYRGSNAMLRGLDDAAVRTVLDLAGPDAPVPCVVDIRHLGGALAKPQGVANAVGNRDAAYVLRVLSVLNGAGIDTVRAAHRRLFDAMAPWATGGRSLSFVYDESTAEDVRTAFPAGDYRRLTELKAAHDPANTFRLGHTIPPA